MDISDWTDTQILQLPDHVFGKRYWISTYGEKTITGVSLFISADALPSKAIVWALLINVYRSDGLVAFIGLRLGDTLPANLTAFKALDKLFPGWGDDTKDRELTVEKPEYMHLNNLRVFVDSGGKKLCTSVWVPDGVATAYEEVGILVSAVPTEIHSWQLSEQAKDRW